MKKNNIIDEINCIYNIQINTNNYITKLIKKYKNDLIDFVYASEINEIIQQKNIFIRYISINGKLEYGGIYYKVEEQNGIFYILLINKQKKIWKISFNDNYLFYKKIENENDNKRKLFENLIKKYDINN